MDFDCAVFGAQWGNETLEDETVLSRFSRHLICHRIPYAFHLTATESIFGSLNCKMFRAQQMKETANQIWQYEDTGTGHSYIHKYFSTHNHTFAYKMLAAFCMQNSFIWKRAENEWNWKKLIQKKNLNNPTAEFLWHTTDHCFSARRNTPRNMHGPTTTVAWYKYLLSLPCVEINYRITLYQFRNIATGERQHTNQEKKKRWKRHTMAAAVCYAPRNRSLLTPSFSPERWIHLKQNNCAAFASFVLCVVTCTPTNAQ